MCAGKLVLPGENDLASLFPELARQWHPTRNGNLTPDSVTPYSNKKVWWRCPLGHDYQASVGARTVNGLRLSLLRQSKGIGGLQRPGRAEPTVAAQWHPTLNGGLTPSMVTAGSHRKVWWMCPSGHVWKAMIYARAGPQKNGCPVCAGKARPHRMERYRLTWRTGHNGSISECPKLMDKNKEANTQ